MLITRADPKRHFNNLHGFSVNALLSVPLCIYIYTVYILYTHAIDGVVI